MENSIIAEVKLVEGQKAKKAKAYITLGTSHGELTIKQISVIHQDGKDPWVKLPTIDFKDKESGEYQHIEILSTGLRLKNAISDAVLQKYKELANSNVPF